MIRSTQKGCQRLVLQGLVALLVAATLQAQAAVYTYQGAQYTSTDGLVYDEDGSISGYFVTREPLSPNLQNADVSDAVLAYAFNDGFQTLTQDDSILVTRQSSGSSPEHGMRVDTDAEGRVLDANFGMVSSFTVASSDVNAENGIHVMPGGQAAAYFDLACDAFDLFGLCAFLLPPEDGFGSQAEVESNSLAQWSSELDTDLIYLSLEEPIANETHGGVGNLRGFAFSYLGIDRVEIYINDDYVFDAPYGGRREDVYNVFPEIASTLSSGYSLAFGYSNLGPGQHHITARAVTSTGDAKLVTSTFEVVSLQRNFVETRNLVDISTATVSLSGDEIYLDGADISEQLYDLTLKWRTAEQGFEIIDVQPRN